jgi:hypothetical protein
MRFRQLPPRVLMYGFFNTWGVVGVALVVAGVAAHEHALRLAGLIFLGTALLDVAVVFPIARARRDLQRRSSQRRC